MFYLLKFVNLSNLAICRPQHRELFDKRVGSFTSPANHNIQDTRDGAYGLLSLSEKT